MASRVQGTFFTPRGLLWRAELGEIGGIGQFSSDLVKVLKGQFRRRLIEEPFRLHGGPVEPSKLACDNAQTVQLPL